MDSRHLRTVLLCALALALSPPDARSIAELPFDATALTLDAGAEGADDLAVGDFDGDGAEDLAFARGSQLIVRFGSGNGHEFEATTIGAISAGSTLTTLGDLDGDGADELAIEGGTVRKCLPDRTLVSVLSVSGAVEFVSGDFDDDGDLDIGVGLWNSASILRNDGGFTFTTFNYPTLTRRPLSWLESLVTGDFDGNGQTDLGRYGTSPTGAFRVLLFDGSDLGVSTPLTLALPGMISIAAADLDSDGKTDLLALRSTSEVTQVDLGVHLYRSLGASFEFQGMVPTPLGPQRIRVGDVDGDDIPDIQSLEAYLGQAPWYRGTGGFAFDDASSRPAGGQGTDLEWMDVDADGRRDVVVSSIQGVSILAYRTTPRFEADDATVSAGTSPAAIAVGDLNGDGRRDFAVANVGSAFLSLHHQDIGGSSWSRTDLALEQPAQGVLAEDLDADGIVDLVVSHANSPARLAIQWGTGGGAFESPQVLTLPGGESTLRARDLDHDGRLDLIAIGRTGWARTFLSGGSRSFSPGVDAAITPSLADVALHDVTEDGWADLIVGEGGSPSIWIHPGAAGGAFGAATAYAVPGNVQGVEVVDANGDGHMDIVAARDSDIGAGLLLGLGGGEFAVALDIPFAPHARAVRAADFDGDGRMDLALLTSIPDDLLHVGTLHYLRGQGDGTFVQAGAFTTRRGPRALTFGDVTGDGRVDLLVSHADDASVRVFTNRMNGTVAVEPRPSGTGLALRAWPTPSSGDLTLELSGRPAAGVEVELFDLKGRRRAGPWTVALGADGQARFRPQVALESGVYFFRAVSEGAVQVTRTVLLD